MPEQQQEQLAEKPKGAPTIKTMLLGKQMQDQIALALPKHLSPERFIRIAITALTRTPKLAECEHATFFRCLLDLSAMGLEPDGRRAHLIPFDNRKRGVVECQLIVDFKGLIELAKRSGDVKSWRAEKVCEKDQFGWIDGVVSHSIDWRAVRGKTQCYYSHVTLADGTNDYEVMTLEEVEGIRRRSRAADAGPWVTDFDEMGKKTVIRRHSKRLTLSAEFHDALNRDDDRSSELLANARVVESAKPQLFAPRTEAVVNERWQIPDAEPDAEPEPASEPSKRGWPKGKPRKAAPPAEEPPDTIPFELNAAPETAKERLERLIIESKLDRSKIASWCDDQLGAPYDMLNENDCDEILKRFAEFKEACS